jgi:hypothetical protein
VSDENNSLARRPTVGSRRVPVLVAAPVVVGCALLGSLIGTTHPLGSMFPVARGDGELGDLRLTSIKVVETPPEAVGPTSRPQGTLPPGPAQNVMGSEDASHAPGSAPSSVLAASTETVDRPLSPGASGDAAATQRDRPELVPSEGAPRAMTQNHRQARAKRLKRMLGRHTRPKPPGAQVNAFISSILPK